MERVQIERLKAQVAAASAAQTIELEDMTQRANWQRFAETALARRARQTIRTRACPHCQSNDIPLHGKDQNGRQRFKCRGCRRSYNILTGTPMARARMPEKWVQYLDCMAGHMPLRFLAFRPEQAALDPPRADRWNMAAGPGDPRASTRNVHRKDFGSRLLNRCMFAPD